MLRKWMNMLKPGKKYLQHIYVTKYLYPLYVKSSYKSIVKQLSTQCKIGKRKIWTYFTKDIWEVYKKVAKKFKFKSQRHIVRHILEW